MIDKDYLSINLYTAITAFYRFIFKFIHTLINLIDIYFFCRHFLSNTNTVNFERNKQGKTVHVEIAFTYIKYFYLNIRHLKNSIYEINIIFLSVSKF